MTRAELAKELLKIAHNVQLLGLEFLLDGDLSSTKILRQAASALEEEERDARRWRLLERCGYLNIDDHCVYRVDDMGNGELRLHSYLFVGVPPDPTKPRSVKAALDAWLEEKEQK